MKIGKGVRNITVSRLFEEGKVYNLETGEEDPNGTLAPTYSHCWLNWQSKRDSEEGDYWKNEAFSFGTVEKAKEGAAYLKKYVIE